MASELFDVLVLPHLDAAFNYARWLTGNLADAEDVVQDACVRAMRFWSSRRHDGDPRAWLFTIVRNTWYTRVTRRGSARDSDALDAADDPRDGGLDPEAQLVQRDDVARVWAALEQLPADFREVIVLREIEGMSYKEIAAIVRVPIGTVMSRLARARDRLAAELKTPSSIMERVR